MEVASLQGSTPAESTSLPCACGSGSAYASCCKLLHQGAAALSAEQLMRSRYTAYALGLIEYLVSSTLPAQQSQLDRQAMAQWSSASNWLGLIIESATPCETQTLKAQVTFVARWADPDGQQHSHRECSDFVRKRGQWYFVDPNHPLKVGRNDPCPCASGKKFKQCCSL